MSRSAVSNEQVKITLVGRFDPWYLLIVNIMRTTMHAAEAAAERRHSPTEKQTKKQNKSNVAVGPHNLVT